MAVDRHQSHCLAALFAPAVGKRFFERWTAHDDSSTTAAREPDLWQPPGPLNTLLEQVVRAEALAIRARMPLPGRGRSEASVAAPVTASLRTRGQPGPAGGDRRHRDPVTAVTRPAWPGGEQ